MEVHCKAVRSLLLQVLEVTRESIARSESWSSLHLSFVVEAVGSGMVVAAVVVVVVVVVVVMLEVGPGRRDKD
jgi:hypothetical protein